MSQYEPKPIDTTGVRLTPRQAQLVHQLAANVHDVWARKRIEDGWRHGPNRNDDLKTHPGLVPFDELSQSEQAYDRVMVEEVIRAAVALGYTIE